MGGDFAARPQGHGAAALLSNGLFSTILVKGSDMPIQSVWHQGLQLFNGLITNLRTALSGAAGPLPAVQDSSPAEQVKSILKEAAQGIKSVLHLAESQVDGVIDNAASEIEQKLAERGKYVRDEVSDTEFHTMAQAHEGGQEQPDGALLMGVHPAQTAPAHP